jgi:FkbM family methyltransferase
MLRELDLTVLKPRFNLKPTGLINVGSFTASEFSKLQQVGFSRYLFIEANPKLIPQLRDNVGQDAIILNRLITDVDGQEYTFNVCNHAQSSSILKFDRHPIYHPTMSTIVEMLILESITLDTLFHEKNVDLKDYNFLMMDVQGAELLVLKGFTQGLKHIDYIYTEVNFDRMYAGCCLEPDLTEYLRLHGFILLDSFNTGHGWGDALYAREHHDRNSSSNQQLRQI